jgi:hypothetical protein
MNAARWWPVALVAVCLAVLPARAHKPSDSYLRLEMDGPKVEGRWDIALRDLDHGFGLDTDGNGDVTWGELRVRHPELSAYALSRLSVQADGQECPPRPGAHQVVRHSDGAYAVLRFTLACPTTPRMLDLDYQLFFEHDAQHRGLASVQVGSHARTVVFSTSQRHQRVEVRGEEAWGRFAAIVREGVWHIWEGMDHLLFLLALLLTSVLRREGGDWRALPSLRPALRDVVRIVTAFTLAHSLTLSLAALEVIRLPVRLVEAGVAASVVVAALNNVRPVLRGDRWAAAFALGLLHGFAFSETLADLGLARRHLLPVLFGFNLGVELGQLAVVAVFLPLAFLARDSVAYKRVALTWGSVAIGVLASVWFVERAFDVRLLPI